MNKLTTNIQAVIGSATGPFAACRLTPPTYYNVQADIMLMVSYCINLEYKGKKKESHVSICNVCILKFVLPRIHFLFKNNFSKLTHGAEHRVRRTQLKEVSNKLIVVYNVILFSICYSLCTKLRLKQQNSYSDLNFL